MAEWQNAPPVDQSWKNAPLVPRQANVLPNPRAVENLPKNSIPTIGESASEEVNSWDPVSQYLAGAGGRAEGMMYGVNTLLNKPTPQQQQRHEIMREGLNTPYGKAGAATLDTAMLSLPAGQIAGLSSKVPGALGPYFANIAGQSALGAVHGAISSPDNRTMGALAGASGGAAGGALWPFFGGIARPRPGSGGEELQNAGVTTTPGINMGGFVRTAEDSAKTGSSVIAKRQAEAITGWSQNVVNKTLPPGAAPIASTGRNAIQEGADAFDRAYDGVFGRVGGVVYDQPLQQRINGIISMYGPKLTQTDRDALTQELNRIQGEFQNGQLDGRALYDLRDTYRTLANKSTGRMQQAYKNAQDALTETIQRQYPQAGQELAAIDSQYAKFLRVQNAAGKPGAADGVFNPDQLKSSVREMDRSANKRAYARGNATLQNEAEGKAADAIGTIPPVGIATAQRLVVPMAGQNLLTVLPYGLSNALYWNPINKFMTGAIKGQGALARPDVQGVLSGGTDATARLYQRKQ